MQQRGTGKKRRRILEEIEGVVRVDDEEEDVVEEAEGEGEVGVGVV